MKNLDECEGYIIALKDVQAMLNRDINSIPALKNKLNEMIEGCEYALSECYSHYEETCNESHYII